MSKKLSKKTFEIFERFMHRTGEYVGKIKFPKVKQGLASVGFISRIDYISNKDIFDEGDNYFHEYTHPFDRPEKNELFITPDGKFLVIKLDKKIKKEGIIG
jgi:hypothetical protein